MSEPWIPSSEETEELREDLAGRETPSDLAVVVDVPAADELLEEHDRFVESSMQRVEVPQPQRFEPGNEDVDWEQKFTEAERNWLEERALADELAQTLDTLIYNPGVVEYMKDHGLYGQGIKAHKLLDRYRILRRV